jgi:uncharacterized protein
MRNPFCSTELPVTAPFCDREKEMRELTSHARNKANVVLYAPRGYGKTSLVKRTQSQLAGEVITIYINFFGVDSVERVAQRLATSLYSIYKKDLSLLQEASRTLPSWKSSITVKPDPESGFVITAEPATRARGIDLLDETLTQFGEFTGKNKKGFHVAFDEFQEITQLPDSLRIEGAMRAHIQSHSNVSYFFIGSRRRLLMDIFNTGKRAFYKSAINYQLPPLPKKEAAEFIMERFLAVGKTCPEEMASRIFDLVNGYPCYIHKIPYAICEIVEGDVIGPDDLAKGVKHVHEDEKPFYESYLQALTKLTALDHIEKDNGTFRVVDPVFALWLQYMGSVEVENLEN